MKLSLFKRRESFVSAGGGKRERNMIIKMQLKYHFQMQKVEFI